MSNFIFPIFLVISFFFPFCLFGENVNISGKLRDEENKPVEFATIRVAGTSIGTNSDVEGKYSLSLSYNDTIEIVFSCIGFKTISHKLIKPKGNLTLNVSFILIMSLYRIWKS